MRMVLQHVVRQPAVDLFRREQRLPAAGFVQIAHQRRGFAQQRIAGLVGRGMILRQGIAIKGRRLLARPMNSQYRASENRQQQHASHDEQSSFSRHDERAPPEATSEYRAPPVENRPLAADRAIQTPRC